MFKFLFLPKIAPIPNPTNKRINGDSAIQNILFVKINPIKPKITPKIKPIIVP